MTLPATAGARDRAVAPRLDAVLVGSVAAVAAAIGLWAVSLGRIDLGLMNDLGLVSVLPVILLAALAMLTLSYAVTVALRPESTLVILLHVLALLVLIYALPAVIEPAARFSVSWRHTGIIEFLTRTGHIDPAIDAYFSWPGFFTLGAFITQAAGLPSAIDLAPWAPLAFNLMYLPPMFMIARSATGNPRVMWTAVWIFFVGNWIGQDYFSPQGLDYFLYLVVVAMVLTWFRTSPSGDSWLARRFQPTDEPPALALRPFQRASVMAIVVLLFGTTVYSHQLTPFALLGVVIVLVVMRRLRPSGLPVLMAVLLGTWVSYMTVQYLSGHIAQLISRIGNVDTTVTANLTDRLRGSNQHLIVLAVRLLTTAALYGLAGIGTVRRLLTGRQDLTWAVLTLAPFGLLALQDYGGEMLLRVYLFSLPFAAILGAEAIAEWQPRGRLSRAVPIGAVCLILMATFLVNRYGNERMDAPTVDEIAGMARLYEIAPKDALLVAVSEDVFWKYRDYELFHYAIVTDDALTGHVDAILARMRVNPSRPAFLVLTRAQRAALELQYGLTDASWRALSAGMLSEPGVEMVFSNPDVQIFESLPRGAS